MVPERMGESLSLCYLSPCRVATSMKMPYVCVCVCVIMRHAIIFG